jgi:hypothetical protein
LKEAKRFFLKIKFASKINVVCPLFSLKQLAFYKLKHKTASNYQLWQEGTHPQQIISEQMDATEIRLYSLQPGETGICRFAGTLALFECAGL